MLEIFGPVPSRRLGHSLGINNIPPKHCSYSCIYCQLGSALHMSVQTETFFPPKNLADAVERKLEEVNDSGATVDYLTIVPDGEPTLDRNLGELIMLLKRLPVPVAIISNGTLVVQDDVHDALLLADWVSLKVDAITEKVWRTVDRPHKMLDHGKILSGLERFSKDFKKKPDKKLVTETMLVENVNTAEDELRLLSTFVGELRPDCAYLSIPTRPPAVSTVLPATESSLTKAYALYGRQVDRVECLIGYEGNAFRNSGNSREDLLSITAVHPMREDAVEELLERNGSEFNIVRQLVDEHLIAISEYGKERFYMRVFPRLHGRFGGSGCP